MTTGQFPDIPQVPVFRRLLAGLVDVAIWAALGAGASLALLAQTGTAGDRRILVAYLVAFITGWIYFAVLEASSLHASIGKRLLGLVVTDLRGRPISFAQASLRHWGKTASALPLFGGFAMAAFSEHQQAFHDWVSDCRIIPREALKTADTSRAARATPAPASAPIPLVPTPGSVPPPRAAPVSSARAAAPAAVVPSVGGAAVDETVRADAAFAKTVLVGAQKGWTLSVVAGPDVGRSFPLGVEARIGRDASCGIHLNDETASRNHALIVQTPAGFVVRDLGSANGTLVEGVVITEPRALRPGETIAIGSTKLTLKSPEGQ